MKCAVVVPTRDRPEILLRAIRSFAEAAKKANLAISVIVISDDSSSSAGVSGVKDAIQVVTCAFPDLPIAYVSPRTPIQRGNVPNSPGDTRNRGIKYLAEGEIEHDAVLMFDDDVTFSDCTYQGMKYRSFGYELLMEVGRQQKKTGAIVGCGYVGRQDLALLDHIMIHSAQSSGSEPAASCSRGEVVLEAPGGISGAFLFVPAGAAELPPFLRCYNEDYFWLRRMQLMGWKLQCSSRLLVHAPNDGLKVSAAGLMFEQYGEALWCASQGLSKTPSFVELVARARLSVAERVQEMLIAHDAFVSQQNAQRTQMVEQSLTKTLTAFRELHETLMSAEVRNGSEPEIVSDLREIASYCGI